MTKHVLFFISLTIAPDISASVTISTFDVASSSMSIDESRSIALAIVSSCFCPFEIFVAFSVSTVS